MSQCSVFLRCFLQAFGQGQFCGADYRAVAAARQHIK